MAAPFDFPKEYGKLGDWPGSINANQAQMILIQAVAKAQGAKFVELGFDGGRTTVALNWAASQLDATIDCAPVSDQGGALWFNRARILYRMNGEKVKAHATLAPCPCDLLVVNPGAEVSSSALKDWYAVMPIGGTIMILGASEPLDFGEKIAEGVGVLVYGKPGQKVIDKVIDNVVEQFSKPKLVAVDNGTALHGGGGSGKRIRKGDSADPEVHAPVVANQGS